MADPTPTPTGIVADVKADAAVVVSFYAKAKAFAVKYGITAAGVGVGFVIGKLI